MNRPWYFALSCLAIGPIALASACSSEAGAPPALESTKLSQREKYAAADRALRYNVAYAAAAAARCKDAKNAPGCATLAKGDVATLKPKAIAPRGIATTILSQLPPKDVICAIVRGIAGGGGDRDRTDAGASEAGGGEDAGAGGADGGGASTPRTYYAWGGSVPVTGAPAESAVSAADVVYAYDHARCQAAAFASSKQPLTAHEQLAKGYTLDAIESPTSTSSIVDAFRRELVTDATLALTTLPAGVTGSLVAAPPAEAFAGEAPTRSLVASVPFDFLEARETTKAYAPFDAATVQMASLDTIKEPRVAGAANEKYLVFDDDVTTGTPCNTSMAVTMLTAAGDDGDFQSSAGAGALASIATGSARSEGVSLLDWCGAGQGTDSDRGDAASPSSQAEARKKCLGDHAICGALSCLANGFDPSGDLEYCCLPDPPAVGEPCYYDGDCKARPGGAKTICVEQQKVDPAERKSYCVAEQRRCQ